MTQIALGTAAGVVAASRMSRSGLLLTVGLVCLLCKRSGRPAAMAKKQHAFDPVPPVNVNETSDPATALPEMDEVGIPEPWPTAPPTSAWDDLRAALTPVLSPTVSNAPSVMIPSLEDLAVADSQKDQPTDALPLQPPPMVEMFLCEPSFPMVPTTVIDGADLPDQIELPDPGETAVESAFLLEPAVIPQPLGLGDPVVVARSEIPLKPALPDVLEEPTSGSLTAPRVVPREVQARKSFFDWLRG